MSEIYHFIICKHHHRGNVPKLHALIRQKIPAILNIACLNKGITLDSSGKTPEMIERLKITQSRLASKSALSRESLSIFCLNLLLCFWIVCFLCKPFTASQGELINYLLLQPNSNQWIKYVHKVVQAGTKRLNIVLNLWYKMQNLLRRSMGALKQLLKK